MGGGGGGGNKGGKKKERRKKKIKFFGLTSGYKRSCDSVTGSSIFRKLGKKKVLKRRG